MGFAEVENEYHELKELLDAGMITREAFRQRLEELQIQDQQGRSWMIGYKSGQWYYYDGTRWVRGTPDLTARTEATARSVPSPPPTFTEPASPPPVTTYRTSSRPVNGAAPSRTRSKGLWTALIGILIVAALAAGAYLLQAAIASLNLPVFRPPSPAQTEAAGAALATETASPTETPTTETAAQATTEDGTEAARATEAPPVLAARSAAVSASDADQPVLNPEVAGTIELWHFWASPVQRQAIRRVIAVCKEQLPNIEVVDTIKPLGDLWIENHIAVAAGSSMPDVIVSDRPSLQLEAADGIYMNLQELADRDHVRREQFYDWAWDQTLYEGNTYGIPFETDVRVLFWNKTLFEQAGLDPEKPPATWDELQAYTDRLDKIGSDGKPQRVGFFPLWNIGPTVWAHTNGADLISPEGEPTINDPRMVEVAAWIKSWVDRYGGWANIQDFANQSGSESDDLFMSGAAAMIADIYGYKSQLDFYRPEIELDNGETVPMEWGVAPLPYNSEPGSWSGGYSMSIPNGAEKVDAAWEFIKCATGHWGQSSWARDTQAQPTNLRAATDPALLADPGWQVAAEALKTSTGGVFVAGYPNWREQLSQRWERLWQGELTPQQALDEAQKAVEEGLGR